MIHDPLSKDFHAFLHFQLFGEYDDSMLLVYLIVPYS